MGKLNLDTLLQPVTPEAPSGDDLAYDAAFLQLEEIFKGTPEKQVGDTIVPAQDPDWKEVAALSSDLLARTKHLRVILIAAVGALETEGLTGLTDGLSLLRGVLEAQWDTLYPRLDPDDNNDPLERMNIVASLAASPGTFGDPFKFVERVQTAPLAASRQLGRFSLRDILIARGDMPAPPDAKPPALSTIDGAFSDTPVEDLQRRLEAAQKGVQDVQAIDAFLDEKVGVGKAPDLKAFQGALQDVAKALQGYVSARTGGGPAEVTTEGSGAGTGGPSAALAGDVASPRDVLLALDKICRYYERSEVSSPVPFILKAAKRMVSKNFVDIAKIMTPEAIRTVEEMGKEEVPGG